MSKTEFRLSLSEARRAAILAQGLDRASKVLDSTLDRSGFIRSLGGVDVYLAARARVARFRRQDLDEEVAQGRFHISPTVRGCIYLIADAHHGPSLQLAEELSRRRVARDHEKVELTSEELHGVGDAVTAALEKGPLTTQALRGALPDGVVRSFGDVGKKIGLSSSLPPALRRLEFDRRIDRTLEDGRLDTERYLWRRRSAGGPETGRPKTDENLTDEAVHRHMAAVFLKAAAFADRDAFAAWSGLSKRAAQKALDGLDTVTVEIEGLEGLQVALADTADALQASSPEPDDAAVAFLPFEDNLLALRQGPAFFVEPAFHSIQVPVWGRGKPTTLGQVRHGTLRSIVAEDKVVGFWEFEPDERQVVVGLFDTVSSATRDRIENESRGVAAFIDEELGHAKSFSIDTEAHMKKRCSEIRGLAR